MLVYKIYAKHEDKMVEKFYRGYIPTYTKNGMLYYSKNIAEKNLAKCEEYKADCIKNENMITTEESMTFELKTYEMKEI